MESADQTYLIGAAEFHANMQALIDSGPVVARHIKGHCYINGKPNDNYAYRDEQEGADPYDWPEIVKGITAATGWTYSRLDTELGLSHGSSNSYGTGDYRPKRGDIRERLLDMARACGVKVPEVVGAK